MKSIYTCPECRRRFTIYQDGDYLCDCGRIFYYPPILSQEKACFISVDTENKQVRSNEDKYSSLLQRAAGFAGFL